MRLLERALPEACVFLVVRTVPVAMEHGAKLGLGFVRTSLLPSLPSISVGSPSVFVDLYPVTIYLTI